MIAHIFVNIGTVLHVTYIKSVWRDQFIIPPLKFLSSSSFG